MAVDVTITNVMTRIIVSVSVNVNRLDNANRVRKRLRNTAYDTWHICDVSTACWVSYVAPGTNPFPIGHRLLCQTTLFSLTTKLPFCSINEYFFKQNRHILIKYHSWTVTALPNEYLMLHKGTPCEKERTYNGKKGRSKINSSFQFNKLKIRLVWSRFVIFAHSRDMVCMLHVPKHIFRCRLVGVMVAAF